MSEKQQNILAITFIILIGIISFIGVKLFTEDGVNVIEKQVEVINTGAVFDEENIDNITVVNTGSVVNILTITNTGSDINISGETQTGEILSSTGGFLSQLLDSKNNINKSQTGTVLIKRYSVNKNFVDTIKREYEELSYKDLFSRNLIKYPEILEYPQLLNEYVSYINETRRIRFNEIEMIKYESLWEELYRNDLLYELTSDTSDGIKWSTYSLYTNTDIHSKKEKPEEYYNCAFFDSYFNHCMLIVEKSGNLEFIYNLYGKVETIQENGQKYIFITDRGGDGCGAYKKYNLYLDSGKLINSISHGISGCDASIRSFSKGPMTLEFTYYSNDYGDFQEGMFYEFAIYYNGKLKEKILSQVSNYNFDVNKNLFNGENIEFTLGDQNSIHILHQEYKDKKTLNDANSFYLQLIQKGERQYSIIGYKNDMQEVSVLNCKDNNINISDEWYTLQKFKQGDKEFTYNISKKLGNYCEDGIYTVKVKYKKYNSEEIVEEIGDYKIMF